MKFGAGLALLDQVWFAGTKETGLPQASRHECCLPCVEMGLRAALWPAMADVGKKPWLGLVRDHTVSVLL